MDTIKIAGFDHLPLRAATARRLETIAAAPSEADIAWLLSRAAAFVETNGVRRPAWTYPELARNWSRRRGLKKKITPQRVKTAIARADPVLFRARTEASKPAMRTGKRGKKVPAHWLLDAYDKIIRGQTEDAALAMFGWRRMR